MVTKVVVTNTNIDEKVTFDYDDTTFLINDESIDWGTASAKHNSYEFPNQVGKQVLSTNIDERDISIHGYIIPDDFEYYGMTMNQVWQRSVESINEKKMFLAKIFNPLDVIRLQMGKYYIEGKPNSSIAFGNAYSQNNEVVCEFSVSLYCNEPMFKYDGTLITTLSGVEPKFHFPLIFKTETDLEGNKSEVGIIFGIRLGYRVIMADNPGSIEIGAKFIMEALGEVKNPVISNAKTGESFKLSRIMEEGEKIIVTTNEGHKSVIGIKDRKEENYFKYWVMGNKYLKLKPGSNLFTYTADDETWNLLDVKIELKPEYFAFPDQ